MPVVDKPRAHYDVAIVGSGAGGAPLARDLAAAGKDVLVVEAGMREKRLGSIRRAFHYYDMGGLRVTPRRSDGGIIIWRTFMAGGATVVACANMVRSLESELGELGISLEEEFAKAEREIGVAPIDESLLSEGSLRIREAAQNLGYRMELMPKCYRTHRCSGCCHCVLGCKRRAKWSALDYLDEADEKGADVLYATRATEVTHSNGKAEGLVLASHRHERRVTADVVVLAAGGLGTPPILLNSGVKDAGRGLFCDVFVNVYATTLGLNLAHEPPMALVNHEFHESEGFIIAPFINLAKIARFMEIGARGSLLPTYRMIGMMTKIADEAVGEITPTGRILKRPTKQDRHRLDRGARMCEEIMLETGVQTGSFIRTKFQGAHPGGTSAIGRIVDSDLQTEIDGLFVCDASVLPQAPGLPPILTIVALSKRLAKLLA
jgi:choline dehydrogenase-like flavoprotein